MRQVSYSIRTGMALVAAIAFFAATGLAQSTKEILDRAGFKGGLAVQLGYADGKMTVGLSGGDNTLVHALEADAAKVAEARRRVAEKDLHGRCMIEQWGEPYLPHAENTVNLLVAETGLGKVPMDEVMRVLVPLGVAMIGDGGSVPVL